jgi:hypothetical protein
MQRLQGAASVASAIFIVDRDPTARRPPASVGG